MSDEWWNELQRMTPGGMAPVESRRAVVGSLADGTYTVQVKSVTPDHITTKAGAVPVLRWSLTVVMGPSFEGQAVEHLHWLRDERALTRMAKDLDILGLPPVRQGRDFASEVREFLPRLVGVQFTARKTSREWQGKTYHELNPVAVVEGTRLDDVPF